MTTNKLFHSKLLAVLNSNKSEMTAIDAFVSDLLALGGLDCDRFFEQLAPMLRGTKRNHLSRSAEDVYPERSDLMEVHVVSIIPGWFLGKDISNKEKEKFLKRACRLAGVTPIPQQ